MRKSGTQMDDATGNERDRAAVGRDRELAIERLQKDRPELAARLSRNLVEVLRQRLDDLHRRSADWIRRERNIRTRENTLLPLQEVRS